MPRPPPASTWSMTWPSASSVADQVGKQAIGLVEGGEVGDLAADMHVDAGEADAGQLRRVGIDLAGAEPGDAELVLGLAGGDLVVGLGVDVRIDPDGDLDRPPLRRGDLRDAGDLGLRFDIEAVDAGVDRKGDLPRRLADAGKDDPLRRASGGERPAEFALGHDVAARRPRRPACGSPTGWSSPSSRSRSACRARRRHRGRRDSGG